MHPERSAPERNASSVDDLLERERHARQHAEALAQAQSLNLYALNQELLRLNATLEQRVHERTALLETALTEAKQASAAKGGFLAKMSHEIRTPMNGIIGMLDALRATPLDATQLDYVNTANASADILLGLINDILDLSKIEAQQINIECINFDLHTVLQQIINLWQPHATNKKLELLLDLDADTPRWLRGDPTRLTQSLNNLIGNSLKFTHEGSVCLNIDPVGMSFNNNYEDAEVMIRFAVRDTGIGMTPAAQQNLFKEFHQADGAATTRIYGGSGLGLAICKQLIELMQGSISVDSAPGLGSCFTVVLPFRRGEEIIASNMQADSCAEPMAQLRILVADDNETNRKVAIAILTRLGFKTSAATDGLEAVHAIQNGQYDLVLMDYHMPIMDGIAATQAIRAWENSQQRAPLPIIAVSASAFQEDKDNCAAAGMNDFLSKPITLASTQQMVSKWLCAKLETAGPDIPGETSTDPSLACLPVHHFNHAAFLEMYRLAGEQFAELLQRYLQDSEQQLGIINSAAIMTDFPALKRSAHKLKGASASVGAFHLAALCHVIERKALEKTADGIHDDVTHVSQALDEVTGIILAFLQQAGYA